MKKITYISLGLSILSIFCVLFLILKTPSNNSAYFLSNEVYNEFDYKIELEEELLSFEKTMNQSLDSMERELKLGFEYLKSIEPSQEQMFIYEQQQNYYLEHKQQEEYNYSVKQQEYYNLIWNRINEYVQEYGKEHDYTYIFGANGDGTIMYANEDNNITLEIKAYVNLKYSGE